MIMSLVVDSIIQSLMPDMADYADNVSTFRGFDIRNGEVSLSDSEYSDYLDEIYGDVQVCGMTYGAGSTLEAIDPTAFRCGKGDYESEIQSGLEDQLSREDSDDIEFIDGDEYDLTDEDEEEESDDE
jgi:hypothetical protein